MITALFKKLILRKKFTFGSGYALVLLIPNSRNEVFVPKTTKSKINSRKRKKWKSFLLVAVISECPINL